MQLNSKETNKLVIKWVKASIDISPQKTHKWPTSTCNDAQSHWPLEEMHMKTTRRCHVTLMRMAVIKSRKKQSVGEEVGKLGPSCTVGGEGKRCSRYGKHGSCSKVKHGASILSGNSTSGQIFKGIEHRDWKRYLYSHVHSSTAEGGSDPGVPRTDEWIIEGAVYTQWASICPHKGRTFWHTPQHGWALRTLGQVKYASPKRTRTKSIHTGSPQE